MAILESIIIIYSLFNLIYMVKHYKRFYCIYPIIAVFDLVMVLPMILELFLGIPDIPGDVYYNYIKAMRDQTTLVIFCLFVLLAQIMFSYELRRLKKKEA